MKKFLHILLAIFVLAPAVLCLCVAIPVERAPVCAMDKPSSCCCEVEVSVPVSPDQQEYVNTSDAPSRGLRSVDPLGFVVPRPLEHTSVTFRPCSRILSTQHRLTTLQTFLI